MRGGAALEHLTGACLRLIALAGLMALLEPAAGGPSLPGLKLIAGLLVSASVLDFFLALFGALPI